MSVASPTATPLRRRRATSSAPEPMNALEVGQWIAAAPTSASRETSRGTRWMAWP